MQTERVKSSDNCRSKLDSLICQFEVVRETGSVLCGTALWDYNWDAVALFIGCYEVALENWVKLRPPKQKPTHIVPTVQFKTTSTQSHAFSTPVLPGLGMRASDMRRRALALDLERTDTVQRVLMNS